MKLIPIHYIKSISDEKTACGITIEGNSVIGSPAKKDVECRGCRRTLTYRKDTKKLDMKQDVAKRGFSCGVEVECLKCSCFDNCRWLIRNIKI